ncbi:MAG: hypothetical protein FJW39_18380 [Acidobacteria bacterium]|nr:hypothetical protein [Acidobacteriota bacterium]
MRRLALALTAGLALAQPPLIRKPVAGSRWSLAFHHEVDGESLVLRDFHMSEGGCGIAPGVLIRAGKEAAAAVMTSDGGATWNLARLPDNAVSGFSLGAGLAWIAAETGVWQSGDCGRTWRRAFAQEGVLRVHFVDEKRGFAAGRRKQVWSTQDGGGQWSPAAAAAEPAAEASRSLYTWIEFAGSSGVIAGRHEPRRAEPAAAPVPWLDPRELLRVRQLPALALLLQTRDGGETWKTSAAPVLGTVSRIRLNAGGAGLNLVEFNSSFEWPAEVYRVDAESGGMTRTFREKDRAVTDILLLDSGIAYLAAIEPRGLVRGLPVPGRVRIAMGTVPDQWQEMEVDYRAAARRVWLTRGKAGAVWAAADTAMILALR